MKYREGVIIIFYGALFERFVRNITIQQVSRIDSCAHSF